MIEELRKRLEKFDQEHLLKFIDELNDEEKNLLIKDIEQIDFEKVCKIYDETCRHNNHDNDQNGKLNDVLEPLNREVYESVQNLSDDKKNHYKQTAFNAIRDGKVGVLLLAGGQGSRLGVSYPKGMYDVGLPSKKSLFQLQAERLRKLEQLASNNEKLAKIHWFIMTSGTTSKTTIDYFENHNYFGNIL